MQSAYAGRHRAALPRADRFGSSPSNSKIAGVLAIGAFPAIGLAIAVVRGGGLSNPWVLPLGALALLTNIFIVSLDIRYGLAMFIVAAGLSPKLPGVYDNLRVEDFVFALVFLLWVSRRLQEGRLPPLRSPIVVPFVMLTIVSVFSTFWGSYLGQVPDLKYSIFLQAKRIEYFLIFYVVCSTVRNEGWLRLLTALFIMSGALAAIYGLANPSAAHDQSVSEMRVTGPEGENYNTLAGYLVVCIAAGVAAIPGFPKGKTRWFLAVCTLIATAGVLASFSREGYVMLLGSLVVFGFTKHRKLVIGALLALGLVFAVAEPVRQNVHNTVNQIKNSREDDPGANSLSARFLSWQYRWNGWFLKQPLIGNGVGSVSLSVDNEYLLRACEVGVVGFGVFCWWLASIAQQVRRLRKVQGLPQFISTGLAAAFVGLLIQGTVAASFNSIRTMEPFWFLLGLVAAGNLINQRQAALERVTCAS